MVTVSDRNLSDFCAKMQSYPEITSCDVDAVIFQGSDRSTLQLLNNRRGQRQLTCKIDFFGRNNYERTKNISDFEALFLLKEPIRIDIGDGFWYRGILTKIGAPETDHELITTVEYTFAVTRHFGNTVVLSLNSANDEKFFCTSNCAKTDCILRLKTSTASNHSVGFHLNGFTWWFQHGGNEITVDGINKIFSIDGQNAGSTVSWDDFPFLVPGENTLSISVEGVVPVSIKAEVEYTPTFL